MSGDHPRRSRPGKCGELLPLALLLLPYALLRYAIDKARGRA